MEIKTPHPDFVLRLATVEDVALILQFIRELAEYERLAHEVVATEDGLRESLFGDRPGAEVVLGYLHGEPVAFALYFENFSTFLGRRGVYLEDLFVKPQARGRGLGKILLAYLAKLTHDRGGGRLDWWVLDWNESAIGFYRSIGAVPMEGWTVHRLSGEPLRDLAAQFD